MKKQTLKRFPGGSGRPTLILSMRGPLIKPGPLELPLVLAVGAGPRPAQEPGREEEEEEEEEQEKKVQE